MPIFEYQCGECGQVTSFLELKARSGGHACEKCGSKKMEKKFSTFAPQAGRTPASKCGSCSEGRCPMAGRT